MLRTINYEMRFLLSFVISKLSENLVLFSRALRNISERYEETQQLGKRKE